MTTVLLHNGAVAPKLEKPRPQVKVVRGGNRGLQRARRFVIFAIYFAASSTLTS